MDNKILNLIYTKTDDGFCRAYYRDKDTTQLFCVNKVGGDGRYGYALFECTDDGEPLWSVSSESIATIEKSKDDTITDQEINACFVSKITTSV
jgi:hypothetical protein